MRDLESPPPIPVNLSMTAPLETQPIPAAPPPYDMAGGATAGMCDKCKEHLTNKQKNNQPKHSHPNLYRMEYNMYRSWPE